MPSNGVVGDAIKDELSSSTESDHGEEESETYDDEAFDASR